MYEESKYDNMGTVTPVKILIHWNVNWHAYSNSI